MGASSTAKVMALGLRYAKSSVAYLAAGSTLVFLTFAGIIQFAIFAFYFMELYGFVASMIFGVSYLMIPAFARRPLHSVSLARFQYWIFNIGTIGLTVGFSGVLQGNLVKVIQGSSLLLQTIAVYAHAYNIWRTAGGWKGSPGELLTKLT